MFKSNGAMLIKEVHLKGIKEGHITLAFRKWQKASIKTGSFLHTSVGLLKINNVTEVEESDISEKDANDAGFSGKAQLIESLRSSKNGNIFKIEVRFYSEDPRIALRSQTNLSEDQISTLRVKLERLDKISKHGRWTEKVLTTIRDHPHMRAIDIAGQTGLEKEWLKINIRKLKNLGLTISHSVGYELSPMGREMVEKLSK